MADYDDEEEELEGSEDDPRKKPQPQPESDPSQPIGKAIGPQQPSTSTPIGGGQSSSIGKPITGGVQSPIPGTEVGRAEAPLMDAPTVQQQSPYASQAIGSSIGGVQPPMTPKPQLHGFSRFLDTLAGSTKIGSAIEGASGLGTVGWRQKNADEQGQIQERQEQQQAQAQTENTGAEAQQREAMAAKDTAQTANIGKTATVTANGVTYEVPISQLGGIIKTQETQQGANDRSAAGIQGRSDLETKKENSPLEQDKAELTQAQANLARFRADPNSPMYKLAQQRANLAQQSYNLRLQEFGYNYDPSVLSPEQQNTLPTDQAGNAVGLHSPLKPGAQQVSAAQRATNVIAQVPRLKQEVNDLQAYLGPAAGRWNGFWQGTVGVDDPKFATIKDDMEYLSSAVALAHAYGRLPTSISEKFDQMYNAGKQDPANMQAALDVAMQWMPKIAAAAQTKGERNASGGGTGTLPPGAVAGTNKAGVHGYKLNGVFHAD